MEDIQANLDNYMVYYYNSQRTNQGRYCQGRTPLQTFQNGLELYQQYVYDAVEKIEVV
jgi:hypothetical protein